MDIQKYIVVGVMVAVWLINQMLKEPVYGKFNLKTYIPLFSGIMGIIFVVWTKGAFSFETILEGLASGFAATGLNEGVNAVFYKNKN